MIIARYNNIILRCVKSNNKLGKMEYNVYFISFFHGTDIEFKSRYHKKYPNYSFQVFNASRKPLDKIARMYIEEYFKTPYFVKALREYNLSKLLED